MAKTVSMAQVDPNAVANQPVKFTVTVANSDAAAVTLSSLYISEQSDTGANVGQPQYLVSNVPLNLGNPIITAAGSVSYGFQVVFNSPNTPGQSPNNAPGGAVPSNNAYPANPYVTLQAIAQTSDGSVFSTTIMVPVLSAVAPFPIPEGGALQFRQGSNLMTLALMGAL